MSTSNNTNTNTYNDSHSISLELELLNKQYSILLTNYNQAIVNYADYENNLVTSGSTTTPFTAIQGQSFWGTSSITNNAASSIHECKASCASTPGCTGATYASSSTNPICALRAGNGNLVPGPSNNYAIIPEGSELLMQIETLNNELLQLNTTIQEKIASSKPVYKKEMEKRKRAQENLMKEYEELMVERRRTKNLHSETAEIDKEQNATFTSLRQNYSSYIFMLIHVIIVVYVIVRFSTIEKLELTSIFDYDTNLLIFCICLILYDIYLFRNNIASAFQSLLNVNVPIPNMSFIGGIFNSRFVALIVVIVIIIVIWKTFQRKTT